MYMINYQILTSKLNALLTKSIDYLNINELNIIKLFNNIDLTKLLESDLYDMNEVIASLTFNRVNRQYNIIKHYYYGKKYSNFDIISNSTEIELKIRRSDLNPEYVRQGGTLKDIKWYNCRNRLTEKTFYFINILKDRLFIWKLNDFKEHIDKKYTNKMFMNMNARNKSNNDRYNFIQLPIQYGNEIEFEQELIDSLSELYKLTDKIENEKTNRKNKL